MQPTLVAKEAKQLSRFLADVGYEAAIRPVTIYEDKQSGITITKRSNAASDGRTKYTNLSFRGYQQGIAAGNVTLQSTSTRHQLVNGLTMSLDIFRHAPLQEAPPDILKMADARWSARRSCGHFSWVEKAPM